MWRQGRSVLLWVSSALLCPAPLDPDPSEQLQVLRTVVPLAIYVMHRRQIQLCLLDFYTIHSRLVRVRVWVVFIELSERLEVTLRMEQKES
jgi:hypothetical protein